MTPPFQGDNRTVPLSPAGNVTLYGYDENNNTLLWVQYPEDTESTRTNYIYDDICRLVSANTITNTGYNLIAQYTYADDLLTSIETGSTEYGFTYGDFAKRSTVKVGNRTLASYLYTEEDVNDGNYDLDRLDYGNGDSVEYTYDKKGRVTKQAYEDGSTLLFFYDNSGNLVRVKDPHSVIVFNYYYDFTNRLIKSHEYRWGHTSSEGYKYDNKNNLSALEERYNSYSRVTNYSYDADNRVIAVSNDSSSKAISYDAYNRIDEEITKNGENTVLTENYVYRSTDHGSTLQVEQKSIASTNMTGVFVYTYDDNGNILSIQDGTRNRNYKISYAYDSANQLIRENDPYTRKTYTWTYDNAGNILSRTEYAYTDGALGEPVDIITYTYSDSEWGDLLTNYNGTIINSDGIGNMLNDDTWTYTWEHGRRLKSMTDGETTWQFSYDANGLRMQRTSNNIDYSYYYNNGRLSRMIYADLALDFTYDADGTPLTITFRGETYYYITNLQGDVIGIMDAAGKLQDFYSYDAWGNMIAYPISIIGQLNPLRYRGYVYDTETGLYYLQSRYYNPELGRFINADTLVSTGKGLLGYNMFAYCNNSPTNGSDLCGKCFHRWDFWNDCEKCGGKSIKDKWDGFVNSINKLGAMDKAKKTAAAVYKNLDASVGVGLGLYGECAVEYLGAGLGINCNLIEVSLSQGNIAVEQTCFMGLQASIAVADVIDFSESMSREFSFISPLAEFTVDEPSQSWTVASTAAYFIAGGSVYLGFDVISFCEDLDEIYGWG